MAVYDSVVIGRIDASSMLPNGITLFSKSLDVARTLAVADFEVFGSRKESQWLGVAQLRFSVWGSIGGTVQEQAAMMVNIDTAHNCGQYNWGLSGHLEMTQDGTAIKWSYDWWDDLAPQAETQTQVWPGTVFDTFEVRMQYIPAVTEADLPATDDDTQTHWTDTRAGTVRFVQV